MQSQKMRRLLNRRIWENDFAKPVFDSAKSYGACIETHGTSEVCVVFAAVIMMVAVKAAHSLKRSCKFIKYEIAEGVAAWRLMRNENISALL